MTSVQVHIIGGKSRVVIESDSGHSEHILVRGDKDFVNDLGLAIIRSLQSEATQRKKANG